MPQCRRSAPPWSSTRAQKNPPGREGTFGAVGLKARRRTTSCVFAVSAFELWAGIVIHLRRNAAETAIRARPGGCTGSAGGVDGVVQGAHPFGPLGHHLAFLLALGDLLLHLGDQLEHEARLEFHP